MWLIAAMSVMTALGAWGADRFPACRRRSVVLGCWFGLLAIVANTCSSVAVHEYGITIGLRDAPPIAAALFFGPVAGLVAGAIAAIESVFPPLWGIGRTNLCPLATFLTAAFAVCAGRLLFEGRRPRALPALVLGVYAEVFHLSLDCIFSFGDLSRFVEIVYAAVVPEACGIAGALVLSAFLLGSVGSLRQNLTSTVSRVLILFAAGLSIIAELLVRNARVQTDENVRRAMSSFEMEIDDQIGYMLHCNAVSLSRGLADRTPTVNEMQRLAAEYDVDELNVFSSSGKPITANISNVLNHVGFTEDDPNGREFLDLANGRRKFVKQKFRQGIDNPQLVAKYIGVRIPKTTNILQLGYSWKRLTREFSTFFFPMMANMQAGALGFFLVTDEEGRIYLPPFGHPEAEGRTLSEIGFFADPKSRNENGVFSTKAFGACGRAISYKPIGPWRVYAFVPLVEAHGPAQVMIFVIGFILFTFCTVFRVIQLRFKSQQQKIDAMRAKEYAAARTIQVSSLPMDFPDEKNFKIFASMETAREVGGDFYDFFRMPSGKMFFLVADVSGKGIPAAMFMMKAKTTIRACVSEKPTFAAAIAEANDRLVANNDANMFVTAWFGLFDETTGELEYVNAGHNPPLVKRADGSVEWIRGKTGLVLAAMGGMPYVVETMRLSPGDSVFLYTDGITEAMNKSDELYGEARLEQALRAAGANFVTAIRQDVGAFVGDAEQSDDMTMLAFDYK